VASSAISVLFYTDLEGSEEHDPQLSERRAAAVRNSLISMGVRPERQTAVSLGESDPIDTNQAAQGRQNNRRAEVRVVFDG
jgi:OOP family OmpA-OmpF porin